jgi:hypothetical protein
MSNIRSYIDYEIHCDLKSFYKDLVLQWIELMKEKNRMIVLYVPQVKEIENNFTESFFDEFTLKQLETKQEANYQGTTYYLLTPKDISKLSQVSHHTYSVVAIFSSQKELLYLEDFNNIEEILLIPFDIHDEQYNLWKKVAREFVSEEDLVPADPVLFTTHLFKQDLTNLIEELNISLQQDITNPEDIHILKHTIKELVKDIKKSKEKIPPKEDIEAFLIYDFFSEKYHTRGCNIRNAEHIGSLFHKEDGA